MSLARILLLAILVQSSEQQNTQFAGTTVNNCSLNLVLSNQCATKDDVEVATQQSTQGLASTLLREQGIVSTKCGIVTTGSYSISPMPKSSGGLLVRASD